MGADITQGDVSMTDTDRIKRKLLINEVVMSAIALIIGASFSFMSVICAGFSA